MNKNIQIELKYINFIDFFYNKKMFYYKKLIMFYEFMYFYKLCIYEYYVFIVFL